MAQLREVYKCEKCGHIIEVLHDANGTLTCCDEEMILMLENVKEAATEKHIPVVSKLEDGIYIKVGSVLHPSFPDHFIEWIEVHTPSKIYRKCLKPGDNPEAIFKIDEEIILVREYCNIHGLWKA